MRTLFTVVAAVLLWSVVIAKRDVILDPKRRRTQAHAAAHIWTLALSIGVALTLMVDDVQVAVDEFLGLANMAWYLAYVIGTIGFYSGSDLFVRYLKRHSIAMRRLLLVLFVVVQGIYAHLYLAYILFTPEWPQRTPRSLVDLIFMESFFGYGVLAGTLGIVSVEHMRQRDARPIVQLRNKISIATAALGVTCFILKMVYLFLFYLLSDAGWIVWINRGALLAMGLSAIAFTLPLLPNPVLMQGMQLGSYFGRLLTWWELRRLQAEVLRFCPFLQREQPSLWQTLRKLDFHTYRMLICILDGCKFFHATLKKVDGGASLPLTVTTPRSGELIWDRQIIDQVSTLYNLLRVEDDLDYKELVDHFRRQSRRLRAE